MLFCDLVGGKESTMDMEAINKLIFVVVGGLLATLGGAIGQYLTHYFSSQREREKLLREKAEELVKVVCRHQRWMGEKYKTNTLNDPNFTESDPADEAHAICRVYFPSLEQERRQFALATAQLRLAQSEELDSFEIRNKLSDDYFEASNILIRAASNLSALTLKY
jgi:hypothetical protein